MRWRPARRRGTFRGVATTPDKTNQSVSAARDRSARPVAGGPVIGSAGRWWAGGLLGAAAVVLVLSRWHAFSLPLEADECNYAYIAARLLAGDRLYVDVWDHQPPGVYALFAGAIALFGDAPDVFRWMSTAFSLASLGLIYGIARSCAGRLPAVAAVSLFAIASADPGTAGEGCNREIYMNTLVLAAWYLALRVPRRAGPIRGPASHRPSLATVAAAGACLGLASTIKTVIAVHWLLLAVWLVLWPARARRDPEATHGAAPSRAARRRSIIATVTAFAVGPTIMWSATLGYFALTHRFALFVDTVFTFNLGYSGGDTHTLSRFAEFFALARHPYVFDSALPLWIAAAAATVWLAARAIVRRDRTAAAIVLLVSAGYIATCLPAHFWPHYYYLMIPSLTIAASVALARATAWAHNALPRPHAPPRPHDQTTGTSTAHAADPIPACGPSDHYVAASSARTGPGIASSAHEPVRGPIPAIVLAILVAALFITEYRHYLSQPPFGITVKRYNSQDFWARAHGANVARVTAPGDTVFVFGNHPGVYYYANRRCASRYTMITGLHDGYPGARRRRETLIADLERTPPRVILVLADEPPFDAWREFLHAHYGQPVGWDFHDRTHAPIMFVLARTDAPVDSIDWNWDRATVGGWFPGDPRTSPGNPR